MLSVRSPVVAQQAAILLVMSYLRGEALYRFEYGDVVVFPGYFSFLH